MKRAKFPFKKRKIQFLKKKFSIFGLLWILTDGFQEKDLTQCKNMNRSNTPWLFHNFFLAMAVPMICQKLRIWPKNTFSATLTTVTCLLHLLWLWNPAKMMPYIPCLDYKKYSTLQLGPRCPKRRSNLQNNINFLKLLYCWYQNLISFSKNFPEIDHVFHWCPDYDPLNFSLE